MQPAHSPAKPIATVPPEAAASSPWPRRRLPIDGTTLAYVECGPRCAPPVLLLHGHLGSHLSWRHLIGPLADRNRVIALDWIGWGESGRIAELRLDYEAEVDRLRRVLDALELPSPRVVAHDYGAFLALGLCVREPARFARLALLNTRAHRSFRPLWRAVFGSIRFACRSAGLRAAVERAPLLALHRRSVAREMRLGILDEASFAYACGWMESDEGRRFFADLHRQYRVAPRPELAAGLGRIRCPTAIVWSRLSRYFPRRTPLELAARIPGATRTEIDGGHFLMEERPAEVLAALRAFGL